MSIISVPLQFCPFFTAQQAIAFDHFLVDRHGYSIQGLMEIAGLALASLIHIHYPSSHIIKSFCVGSGHNGGDGLVAARFLHQWGHPVCIYGPQNAKLSTRIEAQRYACKALNLDILSIDDLRRADYRHTVHIDCLLGVGFNGPLTPEYHDFIQCLNHSSAPILSCDVPSGLDPNTAQEHPISILPRYILQLTALKPFTKLWADRDIGWYFSDLSVGRSLQAFGIQYNEAMNPNHHLLLHVSPS